MSAMKRSWVEEEAAEDQGRRWKRQKQERKTRSRESQAHGGSATCPDITMTFPHEVKKKQISADEWDSSAASRPMSCPLRREVFVMSQREGPGQLGEKIKIIIVFSSDNFWWNYKIVTVCSRPQYELSVISHCPVHTPVLNLQSAQLSSPLVCNLQLHTHSLPCETFQRSSGRPTDVDLVPDHEFSLTPFLGIVCLFGHPLFFFCFWLLLALTLLPVCG